MSVSIKDIGNDTKLDQILKREFTNPLRTGYVEVGEDKVCLPIYYKNYEERIRKFEVRDDDVFLFGLAKTGTTWCHEMLWLIVNDLNYEAAKEISFFRCPLLETDILYDNTSFKEAMGGEFLNRIETSKRPRCIKSHLHWSLLPEQIRNGSRKPKIVLLFRNPKDTCVSHYHQSRATAGYKGTFEEFSELYLGGRAPYGPYWKSVFSLWEQRSKPNVLVITYNEMKENLQKVIKKVARFLKKPLTDEQIQELEEHLSISSMKNNSAVNLKELYKLVDEKYKLTTAKTEFIRAGKVGDYKSLMTPEVSAKFDAWIKENISGTDFNLF
ncbi:hypothetical protein ILUMI_13901 [Ignelater luminosus]|uniref:Sulfotransferase domain-containing protein n=1 Tax=Ignelater luminosus TaxID=2038154 RepID=A0A8K0GBG7_IGNLU|nr:hypothetical protein ILUMI_13901 [Ignelater luminosus]